MNIGMLWFSNDPLISLANKIQAAMDYYAMKYGVIPNYCETNREWVTDDVMPIDTVFTRSIPAKHIWIGIRELSSNSKVNSDGI